MDQPTLQSYLSQIQDISSQDIQPILQQFTLDNILQTYLQTRYEQYSRLQVLIQRIAQEQYQLFYFQNTRLYELVKSHEEGIRKTVAQGLFKNIHQLYNQFISDLQSQTDTTRSPNDYLQLMLVLLCDHDLSVASPILNCFNAILKLEPHTFPFLTHPYLIQSILTIIQQQDTENSELVLRISDLIVTLSSQSDKLHELLVDCNIMPLIVSFYKDPHYQNDILFKMAMVELIDKIADSHHGALYLKQLGIIEQIQQEAFLDETSKQVDWYIQKHCVMVVGKMVREQVIQIDNVLSDRLKHFVKQRMHMKSQEDVQSTLEILYILFSAVEITRFLVKQPIIIQSLLQISLIHNSGPIFIGLLSCISLILSHKCGSLNTAQHNMFVGLGSQSNIENYQTEYQIKTSDQGGIHFLFKIALLRPFQKEQEEALILIKSNIFINIIFILIIVDLVDHDWGLEQMSNQQESLKYLIVQYSPSKLIFDLKKDIRNVMRSRLPQIQKLQTYCKVFLEMEKQSDGKNKEELVYKTLSQ